MSFEGTASFIFWKKLQSLSAIIKLWVKENFGPLEKKISEVDESLNAFVLIEQARSLTPSEVIEKGKVQAELDKLLVMKEIAKRQQSRQTSIKLGEKNTGFFHSFACASRRANSIMCLKDSDGNFITEREDIKKNIIDFYSNLYNEDFDMRPGMNHDWFSKLSQEEADNLELPFSEEEIWEAVKSLGQERAPGPDGYPLVFFKRCWSFLKVDLIAMMQEFFETRFSLSF